MMRPILLAAAALCFAQSAFSAENYVLRLESPEGYWDFDMASIVVVDDTLRRSEMSLKLKRPLLDQPTGNVYDRVVFQYEHDCKAKRMRVVDSLSYLRGEPVKTARAGEDWHPAGESAAQKYACELAAK
jgi:hypothetical protein